MGNKIKNKNNQLTTEFNINFIGEFSFLIKQIEKCHDLKIQVKSKNAIIVENDICKIKLNLIDINKKDNNSKADCIIMEYDIND